jgi:carbon storage regulator
VTCRRSGQSIKIGDDVEIVVLAITPTKVKIGIRAPDRVRVTRSEVLLVQEANAAASRPPARVQAALLERLKLCQPQITK